MTRHYTKFPLALGRGNRYHIGMFGLKQNEGEARERLRAFWRGESLGGRPALLATARNPAFTPEPWRGPALTRKQQDFDPEWQAWSQCKGMRSRTYFAEAMPYTLLEIGGLLTILATLAGGDYEYEGSAWILPWKDVLDKPVPEFDPDCGTVRQMEECFRRLAEADGGDGVITPPVYLDALTTLSMFLNQDGLALALMDRPDDVKRWTRDATSLLVACNKHFTRFLGGLGHSGGTTWLGLYSEGGTEAVQCDFSVMLSPEMFDEFVMPDTRRFSACYGDAIWHLDGVAQMRFIEQIASLPNMRAIQWTHIGHGKDPIADMPHFKRIRELGLSLLVLDPGSVDNAVRIARELGPDGLAMRLPPFEREEDALAAIERITVR